MNTRTSLERSAGIAWLGIVMSIGACHDAQTTGDVGLDAAARLDAGAEDAGAPDAGPPDAGPVVVLAETEDGPVRGLDRGRSQVFRGIPYAAPPLGPLRFAPPTPHEPWATPLDATGPGTACFQAGTGEGFVGSEDCLHVNVWTPALAGSRPVMVFIHGGAFVSFSASEPIFDPTRLAEDGDVVVVSINYRLDVLGWLAHRSLASADQSTGNWGLLDQQAALRWVRANAAHFGGDPRNVTIFGESAGAVSVGAHLVAAGSEGLFDRAIAQSGPLTWRSRERAEAEAQGEEIAATLGCTGDVPACLRSASPEALLGALSWPSEPGSLFNQVGGILTRPTVDGVLLGAQPLSLFRSGATVDVPIIYGANTNEGTLFHGALFGTEVADEAEYRAALARSDMLGFDATAVDAIVARYPVADYRTANDALVQVTSDGAFTCATRYMARLLAGSGRQVRLYHFDQAPSRVALVRVGVFHGAELLFLFGTSHPILGTAGSFPELSAELRGYWSRFARTGDPGGDPAWPAWSPGADERLHLAATTDLEVGYLDGVCDFWDTIFERL